MLFFDVCSVVLRYKSVVLHVWISVLDILTDIVHDNAQLLIGTFEFALKPKITSSELIVTKAQIRHKCHRTLQL